MQTLNTPYLMVQAIRRAYRDAGRPTFAKPGCYGEIVNFAGTAAGEIARQTLTIDSDCDFLWLSTYHYFQLAVYDPAAGSGVANNNSGQFLDQTAAFIVDIRIEQSGPARALHDTEFAFDLFSDGFYTAVNGLPDALNDQSELMGVGVGVVGGTDLNNAISIYRSFNAEPVILPAQSQVSFAVRRRIANATRAMRGHLFLLSGVRLYPVGR